MPANTQSLKSNPVSKNIPVYLFWIPKTIYPFSNPPISVGSWGLKPFSAETCCTVSTSQTTTHRWEDIELPDITHTTPADQQVQRQKVLDGGDMAQFHHPNSISISGTFCPVTLTPQKWDEHWERQSHAWPTGSLWKLQLCWNHTCECVCLYFSCLSVYQNKGVIIEGISPSACFY